MTQTIQQERYLWIKPLIQKKLTYAEVLKTCPHSKRSLERWLSLYKRGGIEALEPRSTEPKTQPNETSIELKEKVIALRKETGLCAKKLHWRLEKQGIHIHERTIGKILRKEGLVRKYRVKKTKYKYLRAERKPGELMEMDVKYVPGAIQGLKYYQYTVIDTASRWRHLEVFDEQTTHHSIRMMEMVLSKFPCPIQAIKTDNHATFTNYYVGCTRRSDLTIKTVHALDEWCAKHNIVHYLIDPGKKPAQNGTVERSHREDEEKFYQRNTFSSVSQLKKKIRQWNEYYNDLEHCSLDGKTPNEVLYL